MIDDLTSERYWERRPVGDEHDWLAEIAELSPEGFVLNAQLQGDHEPTIEPILTRDVDGWRAGRYIGEIRHDGRTLEIRPRLGIDTVIEWISTILNVQVLPRAASSSSETGTVVTQLLAALWRASVLTAGQHALPRTGVKVTSHGLAVRGRLDVSATGRRRAAGHRDVVSTRVVRSYDNAPARAVILADRYFDQRLAGDRWRGARLHDQMAVLRQAVGARPTSPTLHEIRTARYSPITVKWRRAAELSWRIVNDDRLRVDASDDSTHGVLIDVAELWEMFVLHCVGLATELPVRHGTTEHVSGHLARSSVDPTRTLGKLYPDVLVGEDPVAAVIDAKYKRLGGRRGVDREDLYQLHAYATTFDAPRGMLAYPSVDPVVPDPERNGPWLAASSELSFLGLPTEKDACVAKLATYLQPTPSLGPSKRPVRTAGQGQQYVR
ncbi:McrC family protein [Gordonia alkaliphila]|uniref:McrC family protein n=1 Tax=Gordonia alkaliphila TaxID=1053547 RepID=UPI001FF1DF23|nr:McrC family protein [Gordonia alkaliphila]MCK0438625.1 McrC family protein [Gordonia alkaliphila]